MYSYTVRCTVILYGALLNTDVFLAKKFSGQDPAFTKSNAFKEKGDHILSQLQSAFPTTE